jgi:UDP-2-acetamido-3-amino-2,3-dideoxy-glucuronate N-acetyltransferase
MTDYIEHDSSYVDAGTQIGTGTIIWHLCHVMSSARIVERCNTGVRRKLLN